MSKKNVITSSIRRSILGSIVVSIIIAAVALFVLILPYTPYLKAAVLGAEEISTRAEAEALVGSWSGVVDFKVGYAFDTGYYVETTTTEDGKVKSKKITEYFLLAQQEDCLFLIEVDTSYVTNDEFEIEDTVIKGVLREPDKDTLEMMDSMIVDYAGWVGASESMVREYYSLVYLDAHESFGLDAVLGAAGYAALAICLIVFALLVKTLVNPRSHKIYKTLESLGDADEIEAELLELEENSQLHAIALTKKSFVFPKYVLDLAKLEVKRTEDLCWIYWHVQKSKYGKYYYAVLRFTDGAKMSFGAKNEESARSFVEAVGEALPVYYGYSKEREKEYKKLQDFVRDFEEYKAAWLRNKEQLEKQAKSAFAVPPVSERDENQLEIPADSGNTPV